MRVMLYSRQLTVNKFGVHITGLGMICLGAVIPKHVINDNPLMLVAKFVQSGSIFLNSVCG